MKQANKKTIVILFNYSYPLLGLKDIVQRIDLLGEKYNLIIITNNKQLFIKKNYEIILINTKGFLRHIIYVLESRWKLIFRRYDGVFVTAIEYSSLSTLIFRKPIICYGNVNPLQICGLKEKYLSITNKKISDYKRISKLKLLYFALKRCTKIMAISKMLEKEYIANGVDKTNIDLIYMGVDTNIFKKRIRKKNNKKFTIIYPGTISEERGLYTILNGLKILSKNLKNFRFIFIGCSEDINKIIIDTAKKSGLTGKITCLPIMPITKVAEYLEKSDVGISLLEDNAYFRTSPPTKIFEYMACGIPVVANNIVTHTDYLTDGVNSLIINNTPEDLAKNLFKLYKNPRLRENLAQNAYIESKKYTWDSQKKKFLEVFENTLKRDN